MKSIFMSLLMGATSVFGTAALATTVQIDVDGGLWEVDTVTGDYRDYADLLATQVWFGNESLALSFAESLGTQLSGVNTTPYVSGPLFAYTDIDIGLVGDSVDACGYLAPLDDHVCGATTVDENITWAIAVELSEATDLPAVPLPASGLLLAGALAVLGQAKRRKARTTA